MTRNQHPVWRSSRGSPGKKDEALSANGGPESAFCKGQQEGPGGPGETRAHKVSLYSHHLSQEAVGESPEPEAPLQGLGCQNIREMGQTGVRNPDLKL